jgi:hypothetical protein
MRSASADSPRKNNTANQANRASYSSRSRSRSPSQSTSRSQSPTLSRSISKTSPRTTSKSNKNNSTSPIRSGVISKKLMPKYDQASKRTFVAYGVRSKSNQSNLSKCSSESYPGFQVLRLIIRFCCCYLSLNLSCFKTSILCFAHSK